MEKEGKSELSAREGKGETKVYQRGREGERERRREIEREPAHQLARLVCSIFLSRSSCRLFSVPYSPSLSLFLFLSLVPPFPCVDTHTHTYTHTYMRAHCSCVSVLNFIRNTYKGSKKTFNMRQHASGEKSRRDKSIFSSNFFFLLYYD